MKPQLEPGTILGGKYLIERVLGQGGIGVVLAAKHLELDEQVAIKMLLPEHAGNADIVTRFMREGRAAIKIKSEHVARVIDVGRFEDGAPYLVMEYLAGCDLSELIVRRGTLPIDIAVLYLLQACEALAEAHRLGIVHRDLKPSNLYLVTSPDGSPCVKVLDFGISKIGGASGGAAAHALTRTQGIMGSPLYMSPEQLNTPRDVDQRADVWALGVILFELLTGAHPFTAEELAALIVQIVTQPPRTLRAVRPDVPAALEAVIERCLTKQRDGRFADVAQLASALLPFSPLGKSSVERVQRILTMPSSVSGEARSVSSAGPVAPAATLTPLGSTANASKRRASPLPIVLVAGAVLFGIAGVSVWALNRGDAAHSSASPKPEEKKKGKTTVEDPDDEAPRDTSTTATDLVPPPVSTLVASTSSVESTASVAPAASPPPSPTKTAATPPSVSPTTAPSMKQPKIVASPAVPSKTTAPTAVPTDAFGAQH